MFSKTFVNYAPFSCEREGVRGLQSKFLSIEHYLLRDSKRQAYYYSLYSLCFADDYTSKDPAYYGAVYYDPDDHGTAHISVLSETGDAVSATSTINF